MLYSLKNVLLSSQMKAFKRVFKEGREYLVPKIFAIHQIRMWNGSLLMTLEGLLIRFQMIMKLRNLAGPWRTCLNKVL